MLPPRMPKLVLPGFQESVIFSGLDSPTTFQFASDGRIFVAQKNGLNPGVSEPVLTAIPPSLPTCEAKWTVRAIAACWVWRSIQISPSCRTCMCCTRMLAAYQRRPPLASSGKRERHDRQSSRFSYRIGISDIRTIPSAIWRLVPTALFMQRPAMEPVQPLWISARQISRAPIPRTRGERLRSQDLRTPADPVTLDGSVIRIQPDTGQPLRENTSMVVGTPTVDANGVKYYPVTSVYQGSQPLTVRVLEPTNPAPGRPRRFLYVLPVEAGVTT